MVTDDVVLARRDFAERARAVVESGGAGVALHLRGPGASGALLYELACRLRPAAASAGALLLANDRVDVALAAGLDGVQLRERSLRPEVARALLPPGRMIGLSVHDGAGTAAAGPEPDYLVVGTVFATSSHPDARPGGVPLVARVAAAAGRPVLAIGGITAERVDELRRAGAHGVAVVGGVWGAADPAGAVRGYLERLA